MKNNDYIIRLEREEEYEEVENYLYFLDIKNGYMQDLGNHEEEFVPKFDLRNVWNLIYLHFT